MKLADVFCLTLVGLIGCSALTAANAQFEQPAKPKAVPRPQTGTETLRATGTLKGMRGDIAYVTNAEGQEWLVKLPAEPRNLHLVGDARLTWLQPGMMVRFSGNFDAKGSAQEPIQQLEVFTPHPPKEGEMPERFGVFPEQGLGEGNLFGDLPAAETGQQASSPKIASYAIIGQLRGLRKGEMLVAAGPVMVRAELAEDAKLSVNLSDLRWAKVGDEIELDGWYYPYLKSRVVATRVTIRAAEPIGFVPEEPAATPKVVPGAKPAANEEDLPF